MICVLDAEKGKDTTMKTLFINGNIHTMDEVSQSDAFVVEGNKFVYVGTQSGARDYLKAQSFNEVDLKGYFVMPGFKETAKKYGELIESFDKILHA